MDPIGTCLRRVDFHVIDDVIWLYDVRLAMSQSSKSSHSETKTRINYPRGSFKHRPTLSYRTLC